MSVSAESREAVSRRIPSWFCRSETGASEKKSSPPGQENLPEKAAVNPRPAENQREPDRNVEHSVLIWPPFTGVVLMSTWLALQAICWL